MTGSNEPTTPTGSRLLRLPRELRNEIYRHVFASTRLAFGGRLIPHQFSFEIKPVKPAPNSLALLRTCRQINDEVGTHWLGLVLFSFEQPQDMIEKLCSLPPTTISQIRHICTGSDRVRLRTPSGDSVYYRLPWVLKLLLALRLDTLTVFAKDHGPSNYATVEELVRYGNGWKQLFFRTRKSTILGYKSRNTYPYRRKPQPQDWHDTLRRRDGADSGASVTIYRSTRLTMDGMILSPNNGQVFEQKPSSLDRFGLERDVELTGPHHENKEIQVIVNRGHGIEICEPEDKGPPYESDMDIRQWAHGMAWKELAELRDEVEADSYTNPYEYEWRTWHGCFKEQVSDVSISDVD